MRSNKEIKAYAEREFCPLRGVVPQVAAAFVSAFLQC